MPSTSTRTSLCSTCGITNTIRPDGICQSCTNAGKTQVRRETPCLTCGRPTTSKNRLHLSCQVSRREPTAADALPPGDWRFDPFRRVQIYVLHPEPAARPGRKPGPKPVDVTNAQAMEVDCEKCGAVAGDWCRMASGRISYSETHVARRKAFIARLKANATEEEGPEMRACAREDCGAWYVAQNVQRRYCSERCKDVEYHRRRKARDEEAA